MKTTSPRAVTITAPRLTFTQRLAALQAANAEPHYAAALAARVAFDERLLAAVSARAYAMLDAITAE